MDKLQAIKFTLGLAEREASKFYEVGNKAAGTRTRKHLTEIKRLCSEVRKDIQELKARRARGEGSPEDTDAPAFPGSGYSGSAER